MVNLELGKVYDTVEGDRVKVIELERPNIDGLLRYPVIGMSTVTGLLYSYTEDGKSGYPQERNFDLVLPNDYRDFKKGEPVITEAGKRRYFSHVGDDGRPVCFIAGSDPWTSRTTYARFTSHNSVRRPTPEELSDI